MLITRLTKIAMTAALAAFAFIVAYDNIIDYGTNYAFVQHVLSMDTTFPGNQLMHRAITDESIWRLAYAGIIAGEGLTFLLFAIGAIMMLLALRAPAASFNRCRLPVEYSSSRR
jgi:predicted small integral membrane protein